MCIYYCLKCSAHWRAEGRTEEDAVSRARAENFWVVRVIPRVGGGQFVQGQCETCRKGFVQ